MPEPPLLPHDTAFDPEASAEVQAWHTRSGHVLIKAQINGKDAGYMMLDTGKDQSPLHRGTYCRCLCTLTLDELHLLNVTLCPDLSSVPLQNASSQSAVWPGLQMTTFQSMPLQM